MVHELRRASAESCVSLIVLFNFAVANIGSDHLKISCTMLTNCILTHIVGMPVKRHPLLTSALVFIIYYNTAAMDYGEFDFQLQEEALHAFVEPEILEGSNQYFCEKCNCKCNAHKVKFEINFVYASCGLLLDFCLNRSLQIKKKIDFCCLKKMCGAK